jgi:hypothetical protein
VKHPPAATTLRLTIETRVGRVLKRLRVNAVVSVEAVRTLAPDEHQASGPLADEHPLLEAIAGVRVFPE